MWQTEFSGRTQGKRSKRVEYQTKHEEGWSPAERPDRILVSGKVFHQGWVSDHKGYAIYKRLISAHPEA